MNSVKSIMDAMPTQKELQKFSTAVSDIIGSSNAVEAAFKGVVLQRYANALKKTSLLTENLFNFAEKNLVSEEMAFPAGSEEMKRAYAEAAESLKRDIEPESEETLSIKSSRQKKEHILEGLLATLRYTNADVMDLVLIDDETVEIRYAAGSRRKVNIACDSGTAMIRDIVAHI